MPDEFLDISGSTDYVSSPSIQPIVWAIIFMMAALAAVAVLTARTDDE